MKRMIGVLIDACFVILGIGLVCSMSYVALSTGFLSSDYHLYVVQSGSMEPSIMTGDVILVHRMDNYSVNDVITFTEGNGRVVTHRITGTKTENETIQFITKGDANRTEDMGKTTKDRIIGKVALVIPKAGYLVSFSRTVVGFVILIVIPSIILIVSQFLSL